MCHLTHTTIYASVAGCFDPVYEGLWVRAHNAHVTHILSHTHAVPHGESAPNCVNCFYVRPIQFQRKTPQLKVTWLSHSETSTEPTNNSDVDTCAPCGRHRQKAVFTTTGSIQWGRHSSEGEEVVVVVVGRGGACIPSYRRGRMEAGGGGEEGGEGVRTWIIICLTLERQRATTSDVSGSLIGWKSVQGRADEGTTKQKAGEEKNCSYVRDDSQVGTKQDVCMCFHCCTCKRSAVVYMLGAGGEMESSRKKKKKNFKKSDTKLTSVVLKQDQKAHNG